MFLMFELEQTSKPLLNSRPYSASKCLSDDRYEENQSSVHFVSMFGSGFQMYSIYCVM